MMFEAQKSLLIYASLSLSKAGIITSAYEDSEHSQSKRKEAILC